MEDREKELISRAARGDQVAFHQLVNAHTRQLYAAAYAMLGKTSDAEDVVQETLLAAFRGIARFRMESSFKTWLSAILVRQAAANRRGKRPALRLADQDEGETGVAASGEAGVDARLDVAGVLKRLSEEHREILVLRELQGMSYDEIATALGIPRGTVESRLFRARQELRMRLRGYGEGEEP